MKEKQKTEHLWRTEKYNVLWHNHKSYLYIRELLKDDASYPVVENEIKIALKTPITKSNVINAADHMWGYFKKLASFEEKTHYLELKSAFKNDEKGEEVLRLFLKKLAHQYQIQYLIESTILK